MRQHFYRRRDRLQRDCEAHEELIREHEEKPAAGTDQLEQQRRKVIDCTETLKEQQQQMNADQLDLEREQKLETERRRAAEAKEKGSSETLIEKMHCLWPNGNGWRDGSANREIS